MAKIIAALAFLLASASTAFGAGNNFIFFGKLSLLLAINLALGAVLALFAFVLASALFDKLRRGRPQPVRVRSGGGPERRQRRRYVDRTA